MTATNSSSEDDKQTVGPSRLRYRDYAKKWVREEVFWRDVTTRTIAGSIVVLLGYLVALAGGVVALPSLKGTALTVGGSVLLALLAVLAIGLFIYTLGTAPARFLWSTAVHGNGRGWRARIFGGIILVVSVAVLFLLVLYAYVGFMIWMLNVMVGG